MVAELYYVEGQGKAPCMHIFGDSLSEVGNNNNLPTLAKYNYPPYGVDFPTGATGRSTNGLTGPDFICSFSFTLLHYPFSLLLILLLHALLVISQFDG